MSSTSRLPSLQREIDGFKDHGLFDNEFCHEYIARFRFVAPENRECIKRFGVQEEFSEEETAMLLKGVSVGRLSEKTLDKLDRLGLTEELGILPRNLRVFFKKP